MYAPAAMPADRTGRDRDDQTRISDTEAGIADGKQVMQKATRAENSIITTPTIAIEERVRVIENMPSDFPSP